jgi:putative tricarboxylic transport membrane protein
MRLGDTVVGAGFAVAGALVIVATLSYPPGEVGQPGPALFPRIVGGLMAALGLLLGLGGIRAGVAGERVAWRDLLGRPGFVNALFVIGAVVAYIALADRLGFIVVTVLLLIALMWRLGVRPVQAVLVAVAFVIVVYVLFYKVLRVPLPAGLLWW